MCDNNHKAIEIIKKNIEKTRYEEQTELTYGSYDKALEHYKNNNIKFDIVFLDPPYMSDYSYKATQFIVENKMLSEGGFIVIETVPSGEKDRISRISVTGEGAETPRGIKVGSTRSDIVNAYGENGFIENSNLVFSKKGDKNDISGTKIYFRLEDDIVTEFIVFDPGF